VPSSENIILPQENNTPWLALGTWEIMVVLVNMLPRGYLQGILVEWIGCCGVPFNFWVSVGNSVVVGGCSTVVLSAK